MRQIPLSVRLPDRAVFESFLAARNAQALEHLQRLAAGAAGAPSWLCGPPGSGKTHLLQATCAAAAGLMRAGYVPLAEVGAEFLFQVIAERAERTAVIVTTNLPFSEWTQVIPNARLCKALLDRITDQAHILETGKESYRFRRTLDKQKKGAKLSDASK